MWTTWGGAMTNGRTAGRCAAAGLSAAWVSDPGMRTDGNEDACLAIPEQGLLVVSDGMGGENAGELASSLIVQWTPQLVAHHMRVWEGEESQDVESVLRDVVMELNHSLRQESSGMDGLGRMGATVVLALVHGRTAHIAHMGDSRAYLARHGKLERLTNDHSIAAVLMRRGALTPDQAAHHPMRSRLSRYVGMGGNARADVLSTPFLPGDRLLLCTDGITSVVPDLRIGQILSTHNEALEACHALADAAEAAGTHDNFSALIGWRTSA